MIDRFKQFFDKHLNVATEKDEQAQQQRLRSAAAVLLVEMTRADDDVKPVEQAVVSRALAANFELSSAQTAELLTLAEQQAKDATCYHQFTSLINHSHKEKAQLMEMLWEVVFSDGEMEPYEEQLMRRLSDLLHVPHSDFIQTKHRVLSRLRLDS
ncbi:MAG: TerB family tellurite resistance protein [Gammaproteobacteria bacterium]|nr:TerB family tellurite resistance protein [Gammaproteobacteria bacterium]